MCVGDLSYYRSSPCLPLHSDARRTAPRPFFHGNEVVFIALKLRPADRRWETRERITGRVLQNLLRNAEMFEAFHHGGQLHGSSSYDVTLQYWKRLDDWGY